MYDYAHISAQLTDFENVSVIGKSREGRNIYLTEHGNGKICVAFAAAFHALEYLTAQCVIEFARRFEKNDRFFDKIRLYTIPAVNPDGIEIAIHGIDPKNAYHRDIVTHTGIIDFKQQWQANASGVDINHNFDADWSSITDIPSPTKYGGEYPESEPETRAVADFLRHRQPKLFAAFHSQGKELYYDFNGMESKSAKQTAKYAAKAAGYKVSVPSGTALFGGAKDFYIQESGNEAYTVELGYGKNPLPVSQLGEMTEDACKIGFAFLERILGEV